MYTSSNVNKKVVLCRLNCLEEPFNGDECGPTKVSKAISDPSTDHAIDRCVAAKTVMFVFSVL